VSQISSKSIKAPSRKKVSEFAKLRRIPQEAPVEAVLRLAHTACEAVFRLAFRRVQKRWIGAMAKKGLREQLIGAWKLVSYVETSVDGWSARLERGNRKVRSRS